MLNTIARHTAAGKGARASSQSRAVTQRCSAVPPSRAEALQQLTQFQAGLRTQLGTVAETRASHSPPRVAVASGNLVTEEAVAPTASPTTEKAGLLELNAETFWPHIESAGDDLVVVDFYTQWCGPCKLMLPELIKMNEEMAEQGVQFVKFDCNQANKALAKTLNIKVAPTFHLYKNGAKVSEMTGAKVDKLRSLISEALTHPEDN